MTTIVLYMLLCGTSVGDLNIQAASLCADGYKPQGGIAISRLTGYASESRFTYCQAFTMTTAKSKKVKP